MALPTRYIVSIEIPVEAYSALAAEAKVEALLEIIDASDDLYYTVETRLNPEQYI